MTCRRLIFSNVACSFQSISFLFVRFCTGFLEFKVTSMLKPKIIQSYKLDFFHQSFKRWFFGTTGELELKCLWFLACVEKVVLPKRQITAIISYYFSIHLLKLCGPQWFTSFFKVSLQVSFFFQQGRRVEIERFGPLPRTLDNSRTTKL